MLIRTLLVTLVAAAGIACGQEPGDVEDGRSDFVHAGGSCAGACGGEAEDGGCFCDDACARFSDTEVRMTGDGFKGGGLISGADGMVFLGDDLYVVFVQDVFRLRPEDTNWSSARSRRKPLISQLSAITVAEEDLYVVKSEVVHYVLAESLPLIGGVIRPRLPFKILRVDPAAF